jgi:hypothetical protein
MLLAVLQSDIDKSSSWVAPLENEIVTWKMIYCK